MSDYSYWRAAIAGEKPKMFVDDPQPGFYRKGVYERNEKGNKKRVGWDPIAIFMNGGDMVAVIGDNEIMITDRDRVNEMWSYVADNAVPEDVWRAVAERREPWPDAPASIPAANRDVAKTDNEAPEEVGPEAHATAIENAKSAAPKTVTNADEAAKAAGSMNRLAELRLACDKAGQAIYKPLHAIYSKSQKEWTAPVKVAEAEEKRLLIAVKTWQESERKRQEKEAEEAAAKLDVAATPEPVAAPAPIVASYGTRKVKADVKLFAVINDLAAVLAYFKDDPELQQRAEKLATDAVRKGTKVPGTTVREGLL
jgi:hypothetical protein